MKAFKKAVIGVMSATMLVTGSFGLAACGGHEDPVQYPEQIVNGGFENNADESTWTGWTKTGTAFSARGVVDAASVNGVEVDKTGEKFFSGLDGGTQKMTGTLQSDVFKLTGTGKIAFKMGAGKHGDKIFVQFFEKDKSEPLATVTNTSFDGAWITDQLIRQIVDLSEHIGKNIYILITDNDNNDDYGYVNLDDFVVCLTEEDVATYQAERDDQLERFAEPAFDEDPTSTTIQNPGFDEESTLTGWKIMSGTAFGEDNRNIAKTASRYWSTRYVYGTGTNYLTSSGSTGESAVGTIRSSKFTLGGDGYIAFKLAAGKNRTNCYVALCDATDGTELIKQSNTSFSDPATAQMLLRYYMNASQYKGRQVYLKVVDNATSDFGFIMADDFHVSMTEAEVKALQVSDFKAAQEETKTARDYDDLTTLRNYYESYNYLFPLEAVRLTKRATDVVVKPAEHVNLTQYLAEVKATYGGQDVANISVIKVNDGTHEYEEGFNDFSLAGGVYTVTYRAIQSEDEYAEETFTIIATEDMTKVINGDFEMGNLTGWTVLSGSGATVSNGTNFFGGNADFYDANKKNIQSYEKDGTYFLITPEGGRVTVKSAPFELAGDGIISFKMGIGKLAQTYVQICDYETDAELFRITNTQYFSDPATAQVMFRRFVYATEHVGKMLYIKVVDNTGEGFGFINVDSFEASLTLAEAQQILAADKTKYENYRDDVMQAEDSAVGGQAKNIVRAIRKYYAELEVQDPNNVMITTKISNKSATVGKDIDLTAYLDEAAGSLFGVDASTLVKSIVKVEGESGNPITSGFNALRLEEGTYTVTYKISNAAGDKYAEATFSLMVSDPYQIANGGFETGDLTGWTQTGDAFVGIESGKTCWNGSFNQEGEYHLDGWKGSAGEGGKGTLRSSTFTLGGTGKISFRLGGGNDATTADGCYISVKKADGTEIARFTNTKQQAKDDEGRGEQYMWVYVFDLTNVAELGDELYIEIVDNKTSGWGVIFVDDIKTYHTADTFAALGTQDIDYFEATNQLNQN